MLGGKVSSLWAVRIGQTRDPWFDEVLGLSVGRQRNQRDNILQFLPALPPDKNSTAEISTGICQQRLSLSATSYTSEVLQSGGNNTPCLLCRILLPHTSRKRRQLHVLIPSTSCRAHSHAAIFDGVFGAVPTIRGSSSSEGSSDDDSSEQGSSGKEEEEEGEEEDEEDEEEEDDSSENSSDSSGSEVQYFTLERSTN